MDMRGPVREVVHSITRPVVQEVSAGAAVLSLLYMLTTEEGALITAENDKTPIRLEARNG